MPTEKGYALNLTAFGLAVIFDVQRPAQLPPSAPYYALAVGTTSVCMVIHPAALFHVRSQDPDDPNAPHTATPRRLPELLQEMMEDEEIVKVVSGSTAVAERLAADFGLDVQSFVSIQERMAAAASAEQITVQPRTATLQELTAIFLREYLPKVDLGRALVNPKLSLPPSLAQIRVLAARPVAAVRLYDVTI